MKCMAVLILSLQFFPVFPSRSRIGIGIESSAIEEGRQLDSLEWKPFMTPTFWVRVSQKALF